MSCVSVEQAKTLLAKHKGNKSAAARAAGIPRTTFRALLREAEGDESSRLEYLRRRVSELERGERKVSAYEGKWLENLEAVKYAVEAAEPVEFKEPTELEDGSRSPCEMVVHLTDWHYGMVQEPGEVDGFGRCNPNIVTRRVEELAHKLLTKVQAQRAGYHVPVLRVICTGDFISGDIHPELQITNAFPTPVQAVRAGYLLGSFLAYLAPVFEKVEWDFITLDNHSRLTKKVQFSQGGLNSFGYIVAEVAAQHVRKYKNIIPHIHTKPSALVTVGPEKYLAFHGHQIRGWSGKPYYGFDRRAAMEAIKRMGVPEQAFTKMLMGHFHHAFNGDVWMLGGSLTGTDALDHSSGRFSKPHQTSWFVHPVHGEFDWTRWWL